MNAARDLEALLDAIYAARDRGETPDLEALARDHPEHAAALRAHAEAERWVDEAASALEDLPPAPPEPVPPPPIEGFTILREIARGGMGVVFEAEQHVPRRRVAIKMLRDAALASAEEVRRFQREAQAAAELEHPGIVRILEVGIADGRVWYSMPLAEGGSLAERMEARVGDAGWAATIVRDIARAVAHGHSRGVLHRDLKPSNVLLDRDGGVLVADFGLARRQDPGGQTRTRTGAVLGTPAYMSPEQARGDVRGLDERSDVWSLGVLLFQLLAGRPPFVGESPGAVLQQVLHGPVPSLSRVAPGVPRPLALVCHTCLRRAPGDRYASMRDMADDLDRWLAGRPVAARPPALAGRIGQWVRRRAMPLAAVSLGALALALLGVALLSSRERESESRRRRAGEHLAVAGRLAAEGDRLGAALHFAEAQRLDPSWTAERGLLATLAPAPVAVVPTGPHTLWRVRFDPTGRWLASGGDDGRVHLWRSDGGPAGVEAGGRVVSLDPGVAVRGLAFDARGARLATGDEEGRLRVLAADTGAVLAEVRTAGRAAILALDWLDAEHVVAGDRAGRLHHWAVGSAELHSRPLQEDARPITALAATGDGRTVIAGFGSVDGEPPVARVDAAEGRILTVGPAHRLSVWDLAVHAPSGLVATADEAGVRLLALDTLEPRATLPHDAAVGALALDADGRRLLTATVRGDVRTFDLATRRRVARTFRHPGQVYGVARSPFDGAVATVGVEGTLRCFRPPAGAPESVRLAPATTGPVRDGGCCVAPDGRVLRWLRGADDRLALAVHDPTGAGAPATRSVPAPPGMRVAFAAAAGGGWWLAAAAPAEDGTVVRLQRLRATDTAVRGQETAKRACPGTPRWVALAPGGGLLWAATSETVILWDVASEGSLLRRRAFAGAWHLMLAPGARYWARRVPDRGHALVFGPVEDDGREPPVHVFDKAIARVCVRDDGGLLGVTQVDDRGVLLYEPAARRVRAVLPHARVASMHFLGAGRALLTVGDGTALRLWETEHGEPLGVPLALEAALGAGATRAIHACPSPDGGAVLVTTRHGALVRFELGWLGEARDEGAWAAARAQAQLAADRRLRPGGGTVGLEPRERALLRARLRR